MQMRQIIELLFSMFAKSGFKSILACVLEYDQIHVNSLTAVCKDDFFFLNWGVATEQRSHTHYIAFSSTSNTEMMCLCVYKDLLSFSTVQNIIIYYSLSLHLFLSPFVFLSGAFNPSFYRFANIFFLLRRLLCERL